MTDFGAMFPSGRQLGEYVDGVIGQNLSEAEDQRRVQEQRQTAAYRLAVARHWDITEVAFADVEQVGQSGRRWRVAGTEYRLAEEHFAEEVDPREAAGVEVFFQDGAGRIVYLRRPFGNTSTAGLRDAAIGGRVQGGVLLTDTGAQPLGKLK